MVISERQSPFTESLIRSALEPYHVHLTQSLVGQISAYADLLVSWNQKISLTSLRDPAEILKILFGESLLAAHLLPIDEGRLADVGSGAGFPGLALRLYRPKLDLVLIEANSKKAVFLSEIVRRLHIDHALVFPGRTEDYSKPAGQFDFITARAVGHFGELLDWTNMALAPQGRVLLWVGAAGTKEVLREPGWVWEDPLLLPESRGRYILSGRRSLTR